MNLKFLFLTVLTCTLSIPFMDIHILTVTFAQTFGKSFKGNALPFILPPDSERTPKDAPTDAISITEIPDEKLVDKEEKELDRDRLQPLTQQEIQELPLGNNDLEVKELKIIANETSFCDPIKSVVEEIINNDTILSENNNTPSLNSSKIKNKFDKANLEQIFTAQKNSLDSENITLSDITDIQRISNLTEVEDDDIISETDAPDENIVTSINNPKLDFNANETKGKPTVTDGVSSSTNAATEAEIQNNAQEQISEGKSITVEEIPSKLIPSSQLEQQEQQQLEEEATEEQNNVNEEKFNVKEICNDEIDNDLDGIIDEQHECISPETGTISNNENIIPELATLDEKNKDEQDREKIDKESSNGQSKDDKQKDEDAKNKENNENDQDTEITDSKEICNDEMDNDLDGWMDEKEDCIDE